MLTSRFSRVCDVSFKINERESNLFAKLDISRVTRLLRTSNLASNSSNFENCSISLLSGLSLEVSTWEVIYLKLGLSEGTSILNTTLFVIELLRICVCRFLSIDGSVSLRKDELISDEFVICNWYCKWSYCTVYCFFPLWNCKMSPGLTKLFYL